MCSQPSAYLLPRTANALLIQSKDLVDVILGTHLAKSVIGKDHSHSLLETKEWMVTQQYFACVCGVVACALRSVLKQRNLQI